ncbi:esterase/lipase family protein [Cognatilysobacter segetis]|uniref:esterase/lipase family protein n=1 Tax=Cognatilysobacter segetis TaxID=2492394 RepID=UPI00105C4F4C|nr:alpha/beta fold hydrolase [Lysobacter segetis]
MTRRVLLLHGLWMRPAAMSVLARRLTHAGFEPERIGYPSVRGHADGIVRDVARCMRASPCHVVAHSLGGLVTLAALEAEPALPVRRVVCLGSPLCGSLAAHRLDRLPVLGASLGHSRELLHRGCRPWTGRAQVGMIAGNRPIGLGRMLGRVEGENDGAVGVVETRLEGLADHVVVPSSHTGLIFSTVAARQAIAFLRDGRFER